MKQQKCCRMSCDVGKAAEGLENELCLSWSDVRVGEWGSSSLSNSYIASPTLQLILQPFCRFTYVTAHSTAFPLLYLRHRHITYVTAYSRTLPRLHLRHSSFYNPSAASPTSQVILQPFRSFTYVTDTSRTSSGEPPMHRGMKNSVWWTSFLLSLEVATVLDSC